ncbi:MAG: hypothetical protein R3D33_00030 [Hyphomicrobiaceae bacterium]
MIWLTHAYAGLVDFVSIMTSAESGRPQPREESPEWFRRFRDEERIG